MLRLVAVPSSHDVGCARLLVKCWNLSRGMLSHCGWACWRPSALDMMLCACIKGSWYQVGCAYLLVNCWNSSRGMLRESYSTW